MRAFLLLFALLTAVAPATRAAACGGCETPAATDSAPDHAAHHGGAQQAPDTRDCGCDAAQGCHGAGAGAAAVAEVPAFLLPRPHAAPPARVTAPPLRDAIPPPLRPPASAV